MTTQYPNLCQACRHYRGGTTCAAFPDGIPDNILLFGDDHRKPVEGDNGVTFEVKNTNEARGLFEEWLEFR